MTTYLAMLQSIDGYIAKSQDDDLKWATAEDRQFFVSKTLEVGTMIMGSTTFNAMKFVKGTAFRNRHVLVFTSKPEEYQNYTNEFATKVEFFKGTPQQALEHLSNQGIQKAIVVGGGKLIQQFLAAGLVDEIYITFAPKIFGQGIKICDGQIPDQQMQLLDFKHLSQNEILAHYQVLTK